MILGSFDHSHNRIIRLLIRRKMTSNWRISHRCSLLLLSLFILSSFSLLSEPVILTSYRCKIFLVLLGFELLFLLLSLLLFEFLSSSFFYFTFCLLLFSQGSSSFLLLLSDLLLSRLLSSLLDFFGLRISFCLARPFLLFAFGDVFLLDAPRYFFLSLASDTLLVVLFILPLLHFLSFFHHLHLSHDLLPVLLTCSSEFFLFLLLFPDLFMGLLSFLDGALLLCNPFLFGSFHLNLALCILARLLFLHSLAFDLFHVSLLG